MEKSVNVSKQSRVVALDIYRAFGVIFMVLFHFTYDLHHFGFTTLDTTQNTFFIYFRTLIVSIFMSAVGMSLYLAYSKGFNVRKYVKRLGLLAVASVAISVVTYFMFPHTWIYFGVLHMILVASLIGPFFVKTPNISGVLGLIIVGLYLAGVRMRPLFEALQQPLGLPLGHTEDLAPLIPWFGAVLLGIFLMHHNIFKSIQFQENSATQYLSVIGQHSLLIYLAHQPLLFGILGGILFFV